MPKISGLCSSSAAMNSSTSVLIPRSITSKPAPSSIIATRFLPMSWMSPLTVPITTLPTDSAPVSARSGRRIAMPAFIALAASRTSGTKRMPSRKSMPTMRMPSTSASLSTRSGAHPRSSRIIVPSWISSFMPSYRSSCIWSVRSSSLSSARSIASSSLVAPMSSLIVNLQRVGGTGGPRCRCSAMWNCTALWNTTPDPSGRGVRGMILTSAPHCNEGDRKLRSV